MENINKYNAMSISSYFGPWFDGEPPGQISRHQYMNLINVMSIALGLVMTECKWDERHGGNSLKCTWTHSDGNELNMIMRLRSCICALAIMVNPNGKPRKFGDILTQAFTKQGNADLLYDNTKTKSNE